MEPGKSISLNQYDTKPPWFTIFTRAVSIAKDVRADESRYSFDSVQIYLVSHAADAPEIHFRGAIALEKGKIKYFSK